MTIVLGIDAAWTPGNPSGVAVLEGRDGNSRLVAAAASYEAFIARAGTAVGIERPPVLPVLQAAEALAAGRVDVIAVDMPLALKPFAGRRFADNALSRAFGSAGCSTHSPSPVRPGAISTAYTTRLAQRGFRLATAAGPMPLLPALLEVYPHAALLRLCGQRRRLPYKISRSARYWPGASIGERRQRLFAMWQEICGHLAGVVDGLAAVLPLPDASHPLSRLKAFEDTLDAVVCAWVGSCYAGGRAEAFGDGDAAIWVPSALR